MGFKLRVWIVSTVSALAFGAVLFLPPIPQSEAYHQFADTRRLVGIPNALNVLSNFPFFVIGALALSSLARRSDDFGYSFEQWPYRLFFLGAALTGVGSAYYHLAPDSGRLVWDRIPMTVAFMSLLAAMIADRIRPQIGVGLLAPLVIFGAGSVLYWHWTELQGRGDLRAYILVQFFPAVAVVLLGLLFPPRYTHGVYLVSVLGLYAFAKALELLDAQIFRLGHIVSGHTLKHLAASASILSVWLMLRQRSLVNQSPQPD